MNPTSINRVFGRSKLGRRFTVITLMFLSVLLGIMVYTTATIQKEKSNAFLIDIAGRQRMLFQKHINEVFLSSQGITADYTSTRELIRSTLDALMKGGSVVIVPETGQRQTVPAVPTEGILIKLREQRNHFDKIIESADSFLLRSPDDPELHRKLLTLRAQNSTLIGIADEAVKQLKRHSESNITMMVKWESITAFFVALLGVFVTGQGIRASKKLENEIAERERAETELRKSEMFLNSIVEHIPGMIFVKDAKDLRFLLFNKAGEELVGYPKEAMIGKTDYDFFPKSEADFFTTMDREVLSRKTLIDIPEEVIQTESHGIRYLHTKKIPIFDDHGNPQYLLGISEDITDRKQAEEALRESEEHLWFVTGNCPVGIAYLDQGCRFKFVNRQYAEMFGLQASDIVGKFPREILGEDTYAHTSPYMEAVLAGQHPEYDLVLPATPRGKRVVHVSYTPECDESGQVTGFVASITDITEQKQRQILLETLHQAQSQFIIANDPSEMFDHLLKNVLSITRSEYGFIGEVLFTTEGKPYLKTHAITNIAWNQETRELYERLAPNLEFFNLDTLFGKVITTGQPVVANEPLNDPRRGGLPKGHPPMHAFLGLPFYRGDQIVGMVGIANRPEGYDEELIAYLQPLLTSCGIIIEAYQNSQKKIQAEANQRATEEMYRQILDSIPDMVFVKDQNFRILWANKAFRSYYNMTNEELRGIMDAPFNAPEFTKQYIEADAYVLNTGKILDIPDEPVTQYDGQVHFFHTIKAPLFGENGEVVKLVGVARDITERKQTEERLRESEVKRSEALRQSDALKSALLSSVSHELRTPLTAIKTSVSSILGNVPTGMNKEQQEFLRGIDREVNYTSRLVDNLLDMSQIEAGTLIPHREWHPMEDLVEGALRRMEQSLEARNIEVQIPEDILPVFVDAVGIQQVLINLLDNAVKYSWPESPIRLHVRSGVQQIEVEVLNTGEPIQAQDLERIFERFYRRRSPREQSIRGTGLGLAICKGIVEAHDGQIWAESIGGEVKITFIIPKIESMASFSLEGWHRP